MTARDKMPGLSGGHAHSKTPEWESKPAWRPIAECPFVHGAVYLIWADLMNVMAMRWNVERNRFEEPHYAPANDNPLHWGLDTGDGLGPTHFMPMPAPPISSEVAA